MRARDYFQSGAPAAPPTKPPNQPAAPPVRRGVPTRRPDPFRRIHPDIKPAIKPKGVAGPAADGREMAMGMGSPALGESRGKQLARHLLDEA